MYIKQLLFTRNVICKHIMFCFITISQPFESEHFLTYIVEFVLFHNLFLLHIRNPMTQE